MSTIENYIYVKNHIPVELCKALIDECNKKEWKKHTWNNYATGTFESEPTKELDVMPCTKEQQKKITPYLIEALGRYQIKVSVPGEKTEGAFLTKFSPIRFNKYVSELKLLFFLGSNFIPCCIDLEKDIGGNLGSCLK